MFVRRLHIKDLIDVAKLEERVYPKELCLGYYDFLWDLKNFSNISYGVYDKRGKLKGYIIILKEDKNRYYISDLVCLNYMFLFPLLLSAFSNIDKNAILTAELRNSSYKLIRKIKEKFKKVINIKEVELMKDYYCIENGYYIEFTVDLNKLTDIKYQILRIIYSSNKFLTYNDVIVNLNKFRCINCKDIKKYKKFIFKHLYNYNLELLGIRNRKAFKPKYYQNNKKCA